MSLGIHCHRGTISLTEIWVGPTSSPGIVAGNTIPSEASPAKIPQRHVAWERNPQRHVAWERTVILMGKVVNVVVTVEMHERRRKDMGCELPSLVECLEDLFINSFNLIFIVSICECIIFIKLEKGPTKYIHVWYLIWVQVMSISIYLCYRFILCDLNS